MVTTKISCNERELSNLTSNRSDPSSLILPIEMMVNNKTAKGRNQLKAHPQSSMMAGLSTRTKGQATVKDLSQLPPKTSSITEVSINASCFSPLDIKKPLRIMHITKTIGSDNIPGVGLKTYSSRTNGFWGQAVPAKVELSTYPTMWKTAQVCLAHKKQDKFNPAHYHHISRFSIIIMVMEGDSNSVNSLPITCQGLIRATHS